MFPFTLVNEQGSATITSVPGLRVRINGGAWQTLAAAGLTVSYTGGNLDVAGFTGAETSIEWHFEQQQTGEPYSAVDTVGTANTTGTSISSLYTRHTTGPRPNLGMVTANLLPGLPIVSTRQNSPVVTT